MAFFYSVEDGTPTVTRARQGTRSEAWKKKAGNSRFANGLPPYRVVCYVEQYGIMNASG
jgi:hypothetical protein